MMKKVLRDFFILFGLVTLWASTSRTAMQYVSETRDVNKWWGTYQCLNGDLVSMSYLDVVKTFNPERHNTPMKKAICKGQKDIALYLHGDSYGRSFADTDFACLQMYQFIDRNHGLKYHLDTSKKNVLLIEISERYVRTYFGGLQILDEVYDSLAKKKSTASSQTYASMPVVYTSAIPRFHVSDLFNKFINQNLQCNLFNYNFIMPMFETKAALNYYLFNRASGDVVISNDKKFLFFKETVSRTDPGSSYAAITQDDITNLVNNLNAINDHYLENGFKKVYLSIIPNTATIMQPAGYNKLIPLLQDDPRLKIRVIDAYTALRNTTGVFYLPGDTHWNDKGRQLWLDIVNEKIAADL